jgi:dienelactone hydrolase
MELTRPASLNTKFLDYIDGDSKFEAYVAFQENLPDAAPCVLVAHDWSGLNQPIRDVTDRVAGLGYVGFALDLYGKGVRGSPTADNSALMNPLMADRSLLRRRLLAGLSAAQDQQQVNRDRIAVVGYCFGGLCALDLARASPPGLKCATSFHGALMPPDIGQQPQIKTSILILHGWEDPIAPPAEVHAIANELTTAGADWQIHLYGHAKHAFTFKGANIPERGILYDAAADRRSWQSMETFLNQALNA